MCFGQMSSKWRNASSIILASTSTRRVLMLKRGSTAKFMPDSLVFPGGVVDANDSKIGDSYKVAAVRELFEESGVLLTKNGYIASKSEAELENLKTEVVTDAKKFEKLKNQFSISNLVEWNTFLTPATNPRRFFTKFFVAVVKDEPEIDLCTNEMSDYCWVDPKECIEDAYSGKYCLPPPQVYELTRISQVQNWDDCHRFANTSTVICPQPIKTLDENQINNIFPGDHLYIETDIYHQPFRQLSSDQLKIQKSHPTHRAVYHSKPLYSEVKLFQHSLDTKHQNDFHQFETHSQYLK